MVVAPPGVGKSLFLVNQAVQSMIEGKKVLYVSLEMGEDKIAQRFDSIMTLIPQIKLKDVSNQLAVKERLELFKKEFPGSELVIKEFPTGQASINNIRTLLVQLSNYEEFEPDLLIVDYLELMRPTREILQEYHAQQRIAEELRGLAMENNFLVWTATQTNRQGRLVKVITDAELGDSYGKIRTCDFAMSLNQTEEEFDQGRMRGYVIKSRNGRPRFIVPLEVDYSTLRMQELEDSYE
jgi:replicative DNA helicase